MLSRPAAFRAALLATAVPISLATLPLTALPVASQAQTAGATSGQAGTGDVIRVLLDQAAYWRSKNETALADEALTRVLALDPANVDAVVMSHAHIDQCGGLVGDGGALNFPNAQYFIGQADFDAIRAMMHRIAGISLGDSKRDLVSGRLKRRHDAR